MMFKNNTPIVRKNVEIIIDEFRSGLELNNKHFDTKITFKMNGKKVVLHCYNSTQNIKVEGSAYNEFIEEFLEPIVADEIERNRDEIDKYDQRVGNILFKEI